MKKETPIEKLIRLDKEARSGVERDKEEDEEDFIPVGAEDNLVLGEEAPRAAMFSNCCGEPLWRPTGKDEPCPHCGAC